MVGEPVITEAREVVVGGPLHGTTLLCTYADEALAGLTLAEACEALTARSGAKYKVLDWRSDTYLCPCGSTSEEIRRAERLPSYYVRVREVDR